MHLPEPIYCSLLHYCYAVLMKFPITCLHGRAKLYEPHLYWQRQFSTVARTKITEPKKTKRGTERRDAKVCNYTTFNVDHVLKSRTGDLIISSVGD